LVPWKLLGNVACGLHQTNLANRSLFRETALSDGLVECGLATLNTLRIEAGTPLYGVDFDERNFPQEVGRDEQAISFTKGCYLGQETVARIDALGHVNQRIVGVKFVGETIPTAGTELTAGGATVGHVTSAAYSPLLLTPLALAMVRREHRAVGSRLESTVGSCEVVNFPLTA
jgi:folate-binding protein YgfZ